MWNRRGGPRDSAWVKVRPKPWRAAQLGIKGSHPRPEGHRDSGTRRGRAAQLCLPSSCFCVFRPRGSTCTQVCAPRAAPCGSAQRPLHLPPSVRFSASLRGGTPAWTPARPVGLEALSPGLATSLSPSSRSHVWGPWPFPLSPISDSH